MEYGGREGRIRISTRDPISADPNQWNIRWSGEMGRSVSSGNQWIFADCPRAVIRKSLFGFEQTNVLNRLSKWAEFLWCVNQKSVNWKFCFDRVSPLHHPIWSTSRKINLSIIKPIEINWSLPAKWSSYFHRKHFFSDSDYWFTLRE